MNCILIKRFPNGLFLKSFELIVRATSLPFHAELLFRTVLLLTRYIHWLHSLNTLLCNIFTGSYLVLKNHGILWHCMLWVWDSHEHLWEEWIGSQYPWKTAYWLAGKWITFSQVKRDVINTRHCFSVERKLIWLLQSSLV